jgi:CubicO group peptidase (beta-lactamase class C family)
MFKTLTISIVLLLASVAGFSQALPKRVDVVDGKLAQGLDTQLRQAVEKGFGGAIILEVQGKIILKAGYGFANRETRIPFTADTTAQIDSITKPLTALAVIQLADQGKLDLSAPVGRYLPGAAQPAANATLHRLLTHYAGLADSCGDDFAKMSKADLLHTCMAMPLAHPPNQENYSNMGYSILAAVVEQVSGQSWENYLRGHVFEPLAMGHTGFAFTGVDTREFAAGYLNGDRQAIVSDRLAGLHGDDWNLRGNGGVQSSAADMERFYRGLSGREPGISHAVVEQMITPHERGEGDAWEGYGLAVRLDANNKAYRIGHSGSDGVFFSYFGWFPQQDTFVYIVGNNGEAAVKPVVVAVVKAIQQATGVKPP